MQGACPGERGFFLQAKYSVSVPSPEVQPGIPGLGEPVVGLRGLTGRGRCGVSLAGQPGTCRLSPAPLLICNSEHLSHSCWGPATPGGTRTAGSALGLCRQPGLDTKTMILPSGHHGAQPGVSPRLGSPLLAFPGPEAAGKQGQESSGTVLGTQWGPRAPPFALPPTAFTGIPRAVGGRCHQVPLQKR